jgi:hypothetical protein
MVNMIFLIKVSRSGISVILIDITTLNFNLSIT